MKTTAYLLAIYFLFIGAMPCCEPDECREDAFQTEHPSKQEDNEHHRCNNCSPFFNCECGCVLPMVVEAVMESAPSLPSLKEYPEYLSLHLPTIHLGFWQPPKIG